MSLYPQQSFQFDCYPPTLFLQVLGTDVWDTQAGAEKEQAGDMLWGEASVTLAPGERKTVEIVVGFCFSEKKEDIIRQIQDMVNRPENKTADDASAAEGIYTSYWRQALPGLESETDEVLRMEMLWNSYTLEAMATLSITSISRRPTSLRGRYMLIIWGKIPPTETIYSICCR